MLVKAFSEQLPSFICWTLDFGELHGIISELRALNRALNTILGGIRESIRRTFPEHYPLDPIARPKNIHKKVKKRTQSVVQIKCNNTGDEAPYMQL